MKTFKGFGLSQALENSLERMNYTTPTPIQAQAIPIALDGHDIMGTAQTGTGKTAAFAIPLVEKLLTDPQGCALVLTPTRELGKQIMDIMHQLLGPKSPIKTAFIIGGEPMGKQFNQLRNHPRLIVGTPGRINDHLERGSLMLDDAHFLVLDETDRMLDMGFTIQLERIFKYMPKERQTLMFSATLPKNILKMSENYMTNPKRISVGETNVVAAKIKQEVIRIEQDQKYSELLTQLTERTGSVIVFVKTKHNADRMADRLRRDGHTSEALHGDLRQTKRDKVMVNFRKQNFRILIATDIAARGLDVPHIEHVVNYDLPQVAEDFIHRMGRTARAGAEGAAVSFVSNADGRKWHAIEMLINPELAAQKKAANGNERRRGKKPSSGKSFAGKGNFKSGKARSPKKSHDDNNSFGKKKSYGEKSSFKPRSGESSYEDRPARKERGEGKSYSDRPRNDRSRDDRPKSDRPGNDRPKQERGEKKSFGDRPMKKRSEGKSYQDRPQGKKPANGKKFTGKPQGAKPQGNKPHGNKPQGKRRAA
ncbi:MAG: DEAD/DEAH box helicase [Micavibrio sp.]|nr:DEAD/DEAH box helicase [Micavibrio sp.]